MTIQKTSVVKLSLSLSSSQWKKVKRLMDEWQMKDFSDFCKYAVVQIADAHQSKRKDAQLDLKTGKARLFVKK